MRRSRHRSPISPTHHTAKEATVNNAHLERAISRLHNGTTNEVTRAQAEATLALAYEQRTANLIAAFGQLITDDDTVTFLGERVDGLELAKQIKERLDLE